MKKITHRHRRVKYYHPGKSKSIPDDVIYKYSNFNLFNITSDSWI